MVDKFTSKDFDAKLALEDVNANLDKGEVFEDLYKLQEKALNDGFDSSYKKKEGIMGPGGFPEKLKIKPARKIKPQGRDFQDQEELKPREKRQRNVLERMETIKGPLAVLRRCRDEEIKVKVYTRNERCIRGILTGYVVAFDKFWNLVLKDVEEIFLRKVKYKTPSLGEVKNYKTIEDLTLHERDTGRTPPNYLNLSKNSEELCSREILLDSGASSGAAINVMQPSSSNFRTREKAGVHHNIHGTIMSQKEKKDLEHFFNISRDVNSDGSSRINTQYNEIDRNLKSLQLRNESQKDPKIEKTKRKQESEGSGDSDVEKLKHSGTDSPPTAKISRKRRRRKTKLEIRKRNVPQLLIRGENIVLVNLMEPT